MDDTRNRRNEEVLIAGALLASAISRAAREIAYGSAPVGALPLRTGAVAPLADAARAYSNMYLNGAAPPDFARAALAAGWAPVAADDARRLLAFARAQAIPGPGECLIAVCRRWSAPDAAPDADIRRATAELIAFEAFEASREDGA